MSAAAELDLPADRDVWGDVIAHPVSAGISVTALPFPNPLRYALSYLLESDRGVVVVDTGWNSDENWRRFRVGLDRIGATLTDVAGVVMTHVHPDHYGLASRIRTSTDAWIAVHPAESSQLVHAPEDRDLRLAEMSSWLHRCGAPNDEVLAFEADATAFMAGLSATQPDLALVDGEPIPKTGGLLEPIHTPGHTPGHVCLRHRGEKILFTGDHVLPRVTPNVAKRPRSLDDPLQEFIASLGKLRGLSADLLACPGHEWAFRGLTDRVQEIEAHHALRLAEIQTVVRRGNRTVWDVAEAVHWSRPFASLDPRARRSAIGETHSHLHRLAEQGLLTSTGGEPELWRAAG